MEYLNEYIYHVTIFACLAFGLNSYTEAFISAREKRTILLYDVFKSDFITNHLQLWKHSSPNLYCSLVLFLQYKQIEHSVDSIFCALNYILKMQWKGIASSMLASLEI